MPLNLHTLKCIFVLPRWKLKITYFVKHIAIISTLKYKSSNT